MLSRQEKKYRQEQIAGVFREDPAVHWKCPWLVLRIRTKGSRAEPKQRDENLIFS
jgi:hypothetical protein